MEDIKKDVINSINVLQVFGRLDRGGAETMVMNLYRNINRNKINFYFVKHTDKKCSYDDEIYELGGKIYVIPRYKIYNHFQYKKAWNNLLMNNKKIHILHCHVRSTAFIILKIAKKHGIITIAHSHSTSSGKGIKAIIKNLLQYRIRYTADYFMGCSKEANEWLFGKKIAKSDKCMVIKNGIDIKKYSYNEITRKKMREEFDIKGEKLVGNIGRFSYMKNHKFLLEIFDMLCKKGNYKLILVGDGELKNDIQADVKKRNLQDKVLFTGVRKDINQILLAMDILVMPSLFEGLPVSLIEAQASGLKCLITDKITKEVSLTDLVYRENLKSSATRWAEQILKILKTYDRNNKTYVKELKISGYDIEDTTRLLEEFYIEKFKRCEKCI